MSMRQYLLGENVNPILKTALQRQWPDMVVWQVGNPDTRLALACSHTEYEIDTQMSQCSIFYRKP